MTGKVDADRRALLPIRLRHPAMPAEMKLDGWIDTGFTGDLLLPKVRINALGLPEGTPVHSRLANGALVSLQAYRCLLEWFGEWRQIEVIETDAATPLLGVGLLLGHRLTVNYATMTIELI